MKPHTKLYMDLLGYGTEDFIPSEISGSRAVDVNHIIARGMGGTNKPESICNLMAVTRIEHEKFGDKKRLFEYLIVRHFEFLKERENDKMMKHINERAQEGCKLSARYLNFRKMAA